MAGAGQVERTFLFTDIEGSTGLLQEVGDRFTDLLEAHRQILRSAIQSHDGEEVRTEGDSFFVTFDHPVDALRAAVEGQLALAAHSWPEGQEIRVRIGIHTGTALAVRGDYEGLAVHRAHRIMSAGHGGQILLSEVARNLCEDDELAPMTVKDLGRHRLKDLAESEHIFQAVHPDLQTEFAGLKSLTAIPNNLPVQATSFVGREADVKELREVMGKTRMLTLTGPGGSGKTRLAIQTAAESAGDYPDGVRLVELAPVAQPGPVGHAVATGLQLAPEPGRPIEDTIADFLRPRTFLLVLDNCEHVVEACAELTEGLLALCPGLHVLATSREAIGIDAELVHPVDPLDTPGLECEPDPELLAKIPSVRLFCDRAATTRKDFLLTNENATDVSQICEQLEGMPLALELAAARVRSLSAQEISSRLEDRFRLLSKGRRTAGTRHQTLSAAIDWSYNLLPEEQQELLRRLSVFAGGFDLLAAEHLATAGQTLIGDAVDLVDELVSKSLVIADSSAGSTRYRMLETIRQYAVAKLQDAVETHDVRAAHARWFHGLAESSEPALRGGDAAAQLAILERDEDNFRAALTWSIAEGPGGLGLGLASALWHFWYLRGGMDEALEWLARALARKAEAPVDLVARSLTFAAFLAYNQGRDFDWARSKAEEAIAIYEAMPEGDRPAWHAYAVFTLAEILTLMGVDLDRAVELCDEGLAIVMPLGDGYGVGFGVWSKANALFEQGDHSQADQIWSELLAQMRELRIEMGILACLNALGRLALVAGDFDRARDVLEEALDIRRRTGADRLGLVHGSIGSTLGQLASIALQQGRLEDARAHAEEALVIAHSFSDEGLEEECRQVLRGLSRGQPAGQFQ